MPSCDEIRPLMTVYVDDEGTPGQRASIGEHLAQCAACRRLASAESAGRVILRRRAEVFRVAAPAGLVARCQPHPREARQQLRAWFALRPMPMWAAAALVLILGTGLLVAAGSSTTVFAAELALDHLKCFALFENASRSPEPAALARQLQEAYGWRLKVPDGSPALKLHLVGGRRCFSTDGRVAHILYRHDGRPLSLFVVPGNAGRAAASLGVLGHEAVMWSQGGMTVVVMAREPREQLAHVAAYLKQAVQ
jgi:anti-sigma factor RsiW